MKPEKKTQRRERLLDAAAAVFAEKGYASATVADVAARADIAKGTVYGYFTSKEDLFFALFEWYALKMAAGVRLGPQALGQTAEGRLMALGDAVMTGIMDTMAMYTLTLEFWAAASSSRFRERFRASFREVYRNYGDLVSGIIRDGIARGEFQAAAPAGHLARGIVAMWDALGLQFWVDQGFDLRQTAVDCLAAMLAGIRSGPSVISNASGPRSSHG